MARLAVLFATACASCHVGAGDTAALVQRSASAHKQTVAKVLPEDDNCTCKPWKDVYKLSHVKHTNCTMGHELDISRDSEERTEHNPEFVMEWCLFFFGFLPNESFCLNKKWEEHPQQWCYVDPACSRADPPKHHGPFRVKNCSASIDRVSSNWAFPDLVKRAENAHLNLLFLLQYAYPTDGEMLESIIPEIEKYVRESTILVTQETMAHRLAHSRLGKALVVHSVGGHANVLDCTGRTPSDYPIGSENRVMCEPCTLCEIQQNEKDVGFNEKDLYHAHNCRCIESEEE